MNSELEDMLKEMNNIASSHAITSLSKILNLPINLEVSKVRLEDITRLQELLGDPEEVIAGMMVNIEGGLNGMLLLALETEGAINYVNKVVNGNYKELYDFDEMAVSALCETGNILAGTFLSTIYDITNVDLDTSIPQIAIDMAGAILSYPAMQFINEDDRLLIVQTKFRDTETLVAGSYLLIIDNEAFDSLINNLRGYL